MRLREVNIDNFRCLAHVSIDVSDLTVLVGPNGAGKSAFLKALDFFFGNVDLEEADVFDGRKEAVSVECVFDDLNTADRITLGPYAVGSQVVLRHTWSPEEGHKMTGRGRKLAAFDEVRSKSGKDRTAAYKALCVAQPELGLVAATNINDVNQAMLTYELEHPEICAVVDDQGAGELFGYKAVGRSKLADRFMFVLVPAISDAAEEAVEKRGTLLSRLLTAVAEQRTKANEQLGEIERDARTRYEEAITTSHGPVLDELSQRLSAHMQRYVPSARIALEPSAAEFSLAPPRIDLRGGEERELTDLGRQGHGFQRAFVISILEYLADAATQAAEADQVPTLLLAIEEPELYQHPPRARHFARTLASVATRPSVQVCYGTHSPYFLAPERFDSVRIFRRVTADDANHGTVVAAASLDVVRDRLVDAAKGDPRAALARTLNDRFAEAFFSKGVLLVEGMSDVAVFEAANTLLGMRSLESDGITVVPVGGKGSQPVALAILDALDMPTFCVFDGDADTKDGEACPTCGRAKTDRTSAIRSNRKVLKAVGAQPVDFPDTCVEARWACFRDDVETAVSGLQRQIATVGSEMSWKHKSPEVYAEAMRRVGIGGLPPELGEILQRVRVLACATPSQAPMEHNVV